MGPGDSPLSGLLRGRGRRGSCGANHSISTSSPARWSARADSASRHGFQCTRAGRTGGVIGGEVSASDVLRHRIEESCNGTAPFLNIATRWSSHEGGL